MKLLLTKNLITILLLFQIYACKKEKTIDSCSNQRPFTAKFLMSEVLADTFGQIKNHKALFASAIQFETEGNYDSCFWKIGDDPRIFTSNKFQLRFMDLNPYIKVTLIAKKRASICFPNAKTTDTITDYFSIVPISEARVFGKFKGYFKSTPTIADTFEMKYFPPINPGDPYPSNIRAINIPKGCNVVPQNNLYNDLSIGFGYSAFRIDAEAWHTVNCKGPVAYGYFLQNDSLYVNFAYTSDSTDSRIRAKDVFVGKHLQ
jgi:hypothetical protein